MPDLPALPLPDGCLGCSRLEDPACNTVVLLSGPTVCTWCPAWKEETRLRQDEAFAVLDMASKEVRLAFLARREAEFGSEYRRRLEAVVLQTWQRRRAALTGD